MCQLAAQESQWMNRAQHGAYEQIMQFSPNDAAPHCLLEPDGRAFSQRGVSCRDPRCASTTAKSRRSHNDAGDPHS
jgi:hypothetical protein